jgi:hypothetical protein
MSETTTPPAGEASNIQVNLDERDLRTTFANAYRIHTTAEEVVLDLGFNMPNPHPAPNAAAGAPQSLLFKVNDRIVMSYTNTKRLAMSLGQLIKRYEQQFGELQVNPNQPKK